METDKQPTSPRKNKGSSSPNTAAAPIEGVNRHNYHTLAIAFMAENGNKGFMISTQNRKLKNGEELLETVQEWGAWRAFFNRLKARKKLMVMDGLGYYMVPARWPHLFAVGETEQEDYSAGNFFVANRVHYRRVDGAENDKSADERVAAVRRARARFAGAITNPPWHVKPAGYWTQPGFDRDKWDREHLVKPEGNKFPHDPRREKTPADHLKPKYEPQNSAELRTPPQPASAELKRLIAEQTRENLEDVA